MTGEDDGVRLKGDSPAAASEQVLRDRRELAFVAMEFTRMAMVVTDARADDNPIVLANHAFLELTGYSSEEVLGRNCRFLQGPETDPAVTEEIRDAVHGGHGINLETLNYRKDGSSFWNELRICPVHDEKGQLLYHFASQFDVSDRHHTQAFEEAERTVLLREIEHRAKNALALVQGIVRMSRADTAETFAKIVQGRVDALANAHVILAKVGWKAVQLRQIFEAELATAAVQLVELTGPSLEIAAAQVQPLSLVLHEVIDNAVRHGSLSASGGSMAIRWWADAGRTFIELNELGGRAGSGANPWVRYEDYQCDCRAPARRQRCLRLAAEGIDQSAFSAGSCRAVTCRASSCRSVDRRLDWSIRRRSLSTSAEICSTTLPPRSILP